jgi:hypothetical protein
MPDTNKYHPRFTHSATYYHEVLLVLIDALNTHQTDHATATLLNSRAILSPAGHPWTASAVKQSLYKLRNFREVPSRLHQALLQLCFDGELRASQALILFAPRRPQQGTL